MAFLAKRHLSHIKSQFRHPERASDVKNVLFERWQWNLERGSRNMEPWEVARLRLNNFAEGIAKGARATTVAAARGAILAALMELPVTAAENVILVRGRGKTGKEAWTDAARDVGKSAAAGAAGVVVVTGVAMIGVPMAPAVAVPVAVVGGTLYAYSSARRIWEARARVAASASVGKEALLVGGVERRSRATVRARPCTDSDQRAVRTSWDPPLSFRAAQSENPSNRDAGAFRPDRLLNSWGGRLLPPYQQAGPPNRVHPATDRRFGIPREAQGEVSDNRPSSDRTRRRARPPLSPERAGANLRWRVASSLNRELTNRSRRCRRPSGSRT